MLMDTLFPIGPTLPPGFIYHSDFITEAEEAFLLQEIQKLELHVFHFQGYEAKRKVASFGYDWNFQSRTLSKGADIPAPFSFIMERVAAQLGLHTEDFAELLVTEYPTGSVINWHRDAPPFDIIAGISLLTDCTFRLRPHDKAKQVRGATLSLPVKRRSLYIMQGHARSEWQHSITAVKQPRYSITLRTIRKTPDR